MRARHGGDGAEGSGYKSMGEHTGNSRSNSADGELVMEGTRGVGGLSGCSFHAIRGDDI